MTPTIDQVLDGMGISQQRLEMLLRELETVQRPRFARLWAYYTNPARPVRDLTDASERPYRQAQEWGLPPRITGYWPGSDPTTDGTITDKERKEVVIENDIAWRVDTMVDYLFGRMPVIHSLVSDPRRAQQIQRLLAAILARNGGIGLLQQLGLLGAVYGFVDCAVTLNTPAHGRLEEHIKRASGSAAAADTGNTTRDGADQPAGDAEGEGIPAADTERQILEMARLVSLQAVEPARALAILDPVDQGRMLAYAQVYDVRDQEQVGPVRRLLGALSGAGSKSARVIELWTAGGWWRWRDEELEASGGNTLGRIPLPQHPQRMQQDRPVRTRREDSPQAS